MAIARRFVLTKESRANKQRRYFECSSISFLNDSEILFGFLCTILVNWLQYSEIIRENTVPSLRCFYSNIQRRLCLPLMRWLSPALPCIGYNGRCVTQLRCLEHLRVGHMLQQVIGVLTLRSAIDRFHQRICAERSTVSLQAHRDK